MTHLSLWGASRITSFESSDDTLTLHFAGGAPTPPPPLVLTDLQNPEAIALKRPYRYIFDFPATLATRTPLAPLKGTSEIKIAQFSPQIARLVICSTQPLTIETERDTNDITLQISPKNEPVETPSPKLSTRITVLPQPIKLPTLTKDPPLATLSSVKKIILDAGHGGKDTGAIGYSQYREKDVVLNVATKTAQLLRDRGYQVLMTRADDRFIELKDRTSFANDKNGDLFISIHANAVANNISVKGIETYFLSPARSDRAKRVALKENAADIEAMHDESLSTFLNVLNKEKIVASNKLAINIQQHLLHTLQPKYDSVKDNGVKEAPFWVLVGAQMPAVLIELGYITNPMEAERLVNPLYQTLLAEGIVEGIEAYLHNNL